MSEDESCRPVIFSIDGNKVGEEIEFPTNNLKNKQKKKNQKKL